MMCAMSGLVEALRGRRVFTEFPATGVDEWMAVCEVLIQERISAWAFAPAQEDLVGRVLKLYGRRARIGIHGVRTPEQVRSAASLGVHFVTSPVTKQGLLDAAGDLPIALGALTPNEIEHAVGIGAPTIQVIPAEALGMAYARNLHALFDDVELVATGRLEPFQCDMWTMSGARVIGLTSPALFTDTGLDVDLDALRRRCQTYASLT